MSSADSIASRLPVNIQPIKKGSESLP